MGQRRVARQGRRRRGIPSRSDVPHIAATEAAGMDPASCRTVGRHRVPTEEETAPLGGAGEVGEP